MPHGHLSRVATHRWGFYNLSHIKAGYRNVTRLHLLITLSTVPLTTWLFIIIPPSVITDRTKSHDKKKKIEKLTYLKKLQVRFLARNQQLSDIIGIHRKTQALITKTPSGDQG